MRQIAITFLGIIFSLSVFGGRLEKGFEALQILDFFKAKDYFEKSLEKERSGAAFGLCKVYGSEKSQFYDIDSAFKYIIICEDTYPDSGTREFEALQLLNINSESILKEKVYLGTFFYKRATKANTIEAYTDFVTGHPDAKEVGEVNKIIAHLAYLEAVEINSMEEYRRYMDDFPSSADSAAAQKRFDLLEYEKMTNPTDAYSYQVFIKNRPNNPHVVEAQEMVYRLYTEDGKVKSYEQFLKDNPDNPYVNEAWEYVYTSLTSNFTRVEISEFIIDYPEYPNPDRLKKDLILSQIEFFPAKQGESWGFVDSNGAWKISPKYEWVSNFSEGKAVVGFMNQSVIINKRGQLLFDHVFDESSKFQNGLAIVEAESGYGVINFLGDTIIPIEFDDIGVFAEGLIYAGKNDSYGYFNTEGKAITEMIFDNAFDFANGKAIVVRNGKYGVINVVGQPVLQPVYDWIIPDSIYYVAKKNNRFGLISYNGDTLVPFEYDAISTFSEGRAIIAKEGMFQYIDDKGEIVIEEKFTYDESTFNYSNFENGIARVRIKGKVGFIDKNGDRVFPAIFSDLGTYSKELTPVNKGDLWGYANSDVRLTIDYKYKYVNSFVNGLAIVENDTAMAIINSKDEFVIPFDYSKIVAFDNGQYLVQKDQLWGVINDTNGVIIPVEYDKLVHKDTGILECWKDDKLDIYSVSMGRWIFKEEE